MIVFHCGHAIKQRCHELGSRCEDKFMKICYHDHTPSVSTFLNKCEIYQCLRYCFSRCRHVERCEHRCAEICPRQPCKNKCSVRFRECEHYCNGVCGEPCIPCLICRDPYQLPIDIKDSLRQNQIRRLILVELECGHLFKPASLDEHVENFLQK